MKKIICFLCFSTLITGTPMNYLKASKRIENNDNYAAIKKAKNSRNDNNRQSEIEQFQHKKSFLNKDGLFNLASSSYKRCFRDANADSLSFPSLYLSSLCALIRTKFPQRYPKISWEDILSVSISGDLAFYYITGVNFGNVSNDGTRMSLLYDTSNGVNKFISHSKEVPWIYQFMSSENIHNQPLKCPEPARYDSGAGCSDLTTQLYRIEVEYGKVKRFFTLQIARVRKSRKVTTKELEYLRNMFLLKPRA